MPPRPPPLDAIKTGLGDLATYVKIEVCLEHNDNHFYLFPTFYGWDDFLRWWRANEEAYILVSHTAKGNGLDILLKALDE